jgi:hypothetical protein
MELLIPRGGVSGGTMCVLGAGNGNDIDLRSLVAQFDQVHLVDLDANALKRAAGRLGKSMERVYLHGGVDVTALASDPQTRRRFLESCGRGARGGFDVVLSGCLLTQLIDGVLRQASSEIPAVRERISALRGGHLRLVPELLSPGGRGVLVVEVVSSDTFPELPSLPEPPPPSIVRELVRHGNFFTGLDPAHVVETLVTESKAAGGVEDLKLHGPWVWQASSRRHYLVYAVSFVAGSGSLNRRTKGSPR